MSIKTVEAPGGQGSGASLDYFKNNLREYGMLVALVAIILFFAAYSAATGRPTFVSASNLTNLFLQNSYVIHHGDRHAADHHHRPYRPLGRLAGGLRRSGRRRAHGALRHNRAHSRWRCVSWSARRIGAIQGYFVAFLRIPSFIVTLAGMLVFRGLTFMTLGFLVVDLADPRVASRDLDGHDPRRPAGHGLANSTTLLLAIVLAVGFAIFAFSKRSARSRVGPVAEPQAFFYGRVALVTVAILFMGYLLATNRGLPNVLILMAVLIAIYAFVTSRTTIGRRVYAVGGNEKAPSSPA